MTLLPNSWQTPNIFMDTYNPYLTNEEWRVLSYACRHILGWQDKIASRMRRISLTMFERGYNNYPGCGLKRKAIVNALAGLSRYGLMERIGPATQDGQMWRIPDDEAAIDLAGLQARDTAKKIKAVSRTNHARLVSRTNQQWLVGLTEGGVSDTPNQSNSQSQLEKPIKKSQEIAPDGADDPQPPETRSFDLGDETEPVQPAIRCATPTPPIPPTPAPQVVDFRAVSTDWDRLTKTWKSPQYAYIGRANAHYGLPVSPFANHHPVSKKRTADEAVELFRADILRDPDLLLKLGDLRGKTLVCWCKYGIKTQGAVDKDPPCHGDVLVDLLALSPDELQAVIVHAEETRQAEQGDKDEAERITALLEAYLKASLVVAPHMYANKTVRAEAAEMLKHGIKPEHITAYIAHKRTDKWYTGRGISWMMVKNEIRVFVRSSGWQGEHSAEAWKENVVYEYTGGPLFEKEDTGPQLLPEPDTADCAVWKRAFNQLELQIDRNSFDSWVRGARFIGSEGDTYVIRVVSPFAQQMLAGRMYRDVRRIVSTVAGKPVELRFEVDARVETERSVS